MLIVSQIHIGMLIVAFELLIHLNLLCNTTSKFPYILLKDSANLPDCVFTEYVHGYKSHQWVKGRWLCADLSLAVPITNSLTFLFTSLAGRMLGERPESWGKVLTCLHCYPLLTLPPLAYTATPRLHCCPSLTLPPLAYTATPRLHCHPSLTLPPLAYTATPRLHCHPSLTLSPLTYTATPRVHCHPSLTLPPLTYIVTPHLHCHPSLTLSPLTYTITSHTATPRLHCHPWLTLQSDIIMGKLFVQGSEFNLG